MDKHRKPNALEELFAQQKFYKPKLTEDQAATLASYQQDHMTEAMALMRNELIDKGLRSWFHLLKLDEKFNKGETAGVSPLEQLKKDVALRPRSSSPVRPEYLETRRHLVHKGADTDDCWNWRDYSPIFDTGYPLQEITTEVVPPDSILARYDQVKASSARVFPADAAISVGVGCGDIWKDSEYTPEDFDKLGFSSMNTIASICKLYDFAAPQKPTKVTVLVSLHISEDSNYHRVPYAFIPYGEGDGLGWVSGDVFLTLAADRATTNRAMVLIDWTGCSGS